MKRIALFTPLPPARTGTADYAAELIPALAKHVRVDVFQKITGDFHYGDYDDVIYQIANNPYHSHIYDAALHYPGTVVLHEANLHDLIRGRTAHSPEAYLREVIYEMFGRESESLTEFHIEPGVQQPRTFSMMRRLLDRSRACIVHSRHVMGEARRKGFRSDIFTIPHGANVAQHDVAESRNRLNIGQGAFLIGMFGYQRPDKQALDCLAVFAELLKTHPSCRILMAGTSHPEVPIESEVRRLGLQNNVTLIGHQPLDDLDRCIAACDMVVNLRNPTFGETSGIVMRSFGMSRTVVVSDSGADREWPDDICVRIPCDRHQDAVLLETLKWLASSSEITEEIGRSAQRWVSENATWEMVAKLYVTALEPKPPTGEMPMARVNEIGFTREYLKGWVKPDSVAESYFQGHEARLIRSLQLTPYGGDRDRILEMGCYLQLTPALRDLMGYAEVRGCYLGSGGVDTKSVLSRDGEYFECPIDLFDCEKDRFPYPDEHFSTVLCCELLEHLRVDPMRALSEIHRILKPDGILLLTTPNVVSLRAVNAVLRGNHPGFYSHYSDPDSPEASDPRHEREYTPVEVSKLLTAAGFVVNHIETGAYGRAKFPEADWVKKALMTLGQSTALRDECIFSVGRKAAIPLEFRPPWLYDSRTSAIEDS